MEGNAEIYQVLNMRLLDAAIMGDIPSFLNLLQIDPLILDRCMIAKSMRSPLHVVAKLGHLDFAKEVLKAKPELAEELDELKRWSPLHVASEKGYLEIVKALLAVNQNMCFARDQDGRNPLHVAAMNGHIHVLKVLFQVNPQAARKRTNDSETVLHLCVKHLDQTGALTFLADVKDDDELLNSKDADGNTVLHLAVTAKQPEIVEFLLKHKMMERNMINANGSTAMDVLNKSGKNENHKEIWQLLKRAKEVPAKDAVKPQNRNKAKLENHRNGLMVAASLIATMAFQVGINPPGGAWQDGNIDLPMTGTSRTNHTAGLSIMSYVNGFYLNAMLITNTIGLVSSLSVILLLISGLPCKRLFVGIATITMWIAVTATMSTYVVSVNFLSYYSANDYGIYFYVLPIIMAVLLLAHICRFIVKLIKKVVQPGKKLLYQSAANHLPV